MAGGVADWLNAPVTFVRVFLALALAFFPPIQWIYVAAAALMPPRGRNRPGWDNVVVLGRLAVLIGVPVLVIGDSIVVNEAFDDDRGYWIALYGLQLVGVILLFSADYLRDGPRNETQQRAVVLGAMPVAIAVAALAVGVFSVTDVRWERIVPLVVLVAGVALLGGACAGRARPFVGPAVVAVGVAAALSAADVRLEGGVGDLQITESRASAEPIVVRRAFGDVDVDLRQLRSSRSIRLEASVGEGRLRVAVPSQARVVVDARVGHGSIRATSVNVPSPYVTGFDRRVSLDWPSRRREQPPAATIHVAAAVGIGELAVERGREALVAR